MGGTSSTVGKVQGFARRYSNALGFRQRGENFHGSNTPALVAATLGVVPEHNAAIRSPAKNPVLLPVAAMLKEHEIRDMERAKRLHIEMEREQRKDREYGHIINLGICPEAKHTDGYLKSVSTLTSSR